MAVVIPNFETLSRNHYCGRLTAVNKYILMPLVAVALATDATAETIRAARFEPLVNLPGGIKASKWQK